MLVFLGCPYSLMIRSKSSLITFFIYFLSLRIFVYFSIFFLVFSFSFFNASNSRPIRRERRISRIASACISVKSKVFAIFLSSAIRYLTLSTLPVIKHSFASAFVLLPLIVSITASKTSIALIKPSCTSAFSFSFVSIVVYFRWFTSNKKLMWYSNADFKERVSGRPSAIASMLTPKVSSSFVLLSRIVLIFSASSSDTFFFKSRTILMPSFDDWLEISTISGICFESTNNATSFKKFAIPAPIIVYGISVMTRRFDCLFFSCTTLPCTLIFPVPVL